MLRRATLPELTWEADERSFFFTRSEEQYTEEELELQAIQLQLAPTEGEA